VLSLSVTNSYYQLVMTLVPVWAVFGLSWNLLSGYTGLISFGHAAFFGIGAYTPRSARSISTCRPGI
jgi:ABC-type branched-subunit amino acid transport system permease subunit